MTSGDEGRAGLVVVGVTGGVAAYKVVSTVRALVLAGFDVQVVATEAALKFVGAATWEAISRNPVLTDLYADTSRVPHVSLAGRADVLLVAPATANVIAKLANGLADDFLTNVVLASTAPLVVAPAMHTEMWRHPATQANIGTLVARGAVVVGPASGPLTGDDSGPGRLMEPEELFAAVSAVAPARRGSLSGRKILVSAGGTREAIDPVRFVGNRSTGRQGIALAEAAARRGAEVTLVAANVELVPPPGITVVSVTTATELQQEMSDRAPESDVIVMAAAVADYRPEKTQDAKIKKSSAGKKLTLQLVANPDILAGLAARSRPDQTVVGFAAETEEDDAARLEIGRAKAAAKGVDLLVLNRVGWTEGFGSADNAVTVIGRSGDVLLQATGTKVSVAERILDLLVDRPR